MQHRLVMAWHECSTLIPEWAAGAAERSASADIGNTHSSMFDAVIGVKLAASRSAGGGVPGAAGAWVAPLPLLLRSGSLIAVTSLFL